MPISPSTLKAVRLTHRYIGVFIAPALLFFAFTGALQTFSLHETTRGSSYKPPAWAVTLSQIHKKQTPIVPEKKPPSPDKPQPAGAASDSPAHPHGLASAPAPAAPTVATTHNPLPLKVFFLLVAVGLFTSTAIGIYMSYKYSREKALITALLVAGVIIPVAMILI